MRSLKIYKSSDIGRLGRREQRGGNRGGSDLLNFGMILMGIQDPRILVGHLGLHHSSPREVEMIARDNRARGEFVDSSLQQYRRPE